jgi:type II secretory pathway pseudopilin PulG
MSTGAIIAIVVVALIIIALFAFVLPRMRARARVRARERELQQRREQVAGEHRAEAETRQREAAQAEQKARIAQKEAEAQRAQAQLHEERAGLHERGMADDELIDDHERDRFEGTSAMRPSTDDDAAERGTLDNDRNATTGGAVASGAAGSDGMGDYERGRRDEAATEGHAPRFNRDEETVRDEERTSR